MRFIKKQKRKTECGVVAYINAMKWAKIPLKNRKNLDSIVGHNVGIGTPHTNLIKALRKHFVVKGKMTTSINYIDKNLKSNEAIILLYRIDKQQEAWHYSFIEQKKGNKYRIFNSHLKEWADKKELYTTLRKCKRNYVISIRLKQKEKK